MFRRKYKFFEKTDYGIDANNSSQQAQQKDEEPLMRKKLYQKIIFRHDEQQQKNYEDQKLFHKRNTFSGTIPNLFSSNATDNISAVRLIVTGFRQRPLKVMTL